MRKRGGAQVKNHSHQQGGPRTRSKARQVKVQPGPSDTTKIDTMVEDMDSSLSSLSPSPAASGVAQDQYSIKNLLSNTEPQSPGLLEVANEGAAEDVLAGPETGTGIHDNAMLSGEATQPVRMEENLSLDHFGTSTIAPRKEISGEEPEQEVPDSCPPETSPLPQRKRRRTSESEYVEVESLNGVAEKGFETERRSSRRSSPRVLVPASSPLPNTPSPHPSPGASS